MFNTVPTKQRGENIAALAAEKKLEIQADSTFGFEDARLVSRTCCSFAIFTH